MVDPERIGALLQTLEGYRDHLARLRDLPAEEYEEQAFAGRYLVQAAAQTCIDLASHVVSSEGWRTPNDFRDTFTVLEEEGVLEAPLAERLRALAGLRNRLVHMYATVDDRLVQEALSEGLDDLAAFSVAVARLTDSSSS